MKQMWLVGLAVALVGACGGGGEDSWDGGEFRAAAEQRIRNDEDAAEVICETPMSTEAGFVFLCRAPHAGDSDGDAAWDDYKVTIVGPSTFKVTPDDRFGG